MTAAIHDHHHLYRHVLLRNPDWTCWHGVARDGLNSNIKESVDAINNPGSAMTLQRWLTAAGMCCLLGIGIATTAPFNDAAAAYIEGDYVQAIKILRPLAVQGNVIAQFGLGWMYAHGQGVTQDYPAALQWYRLAAAQGNAGAQFNLGWMYAHGQGITRDYPAALQWYRLAAAQRSADAQFNLGWMYEHGQGVTQDYQEALQWYRLAAAQGLAVAQSHLGVRYASGQGVTQDYPAAVKWFRLAAAQRDARAQFQLGWMYDNGQGVVQDYAEAVQWYHLAAAQGFGPARTILERPDMVAAAQRLAVMQVQPQQPQQFLQPVHNRMKTRERILAPELVLESSAPRADGSIELSGRITSSAGISQILLNGRELEVPLAKDGSFKVTRVPPMGVTTYWLSVVDEFGQREDVEVNAERRAIQQTEEVAPLDPRKMRAKVNPDAVALIVGIEAYASLPPAQYADLDANHFYDFAHHALGVPISRIKLLTDAQAGRTDLLKAMRSWMKSEIAGGKSDVYIFFAGHGLASDDGAKTYLLPADGDLGLLDETSVLRDDLIASAKGARTITLFLDTCYSGGTRGTEVLLAGARPIAIVPDESGLPANVTLLAAATGAQLSSTYDAAQHGLFSYWLMKGLEGEAEANGDRTITTGELHDYVSKRVRQVAARRNRQQDPQLIGDSTRILVSY
ncbi:MAG: caspase family protein [Nitrosospira sp.]|nr:caspase family protein [Nitrosospira sp.]